ncbi:MAG: amidohydrolase [Clostridiales Family XIII bacterium]|jgi:hippurate hydrolase|nr:amidohydrolase [Clostridiales Family XIII bacterium]
MNDRELSLKLSGYRRDLHRIPELDRDLPKTTAYLRERLDRLPCEIREAGDAGFCVIFRANAADGDAGAGNADSAGKITRTKIGKDALAFRTDMDALPIAENTGFTFASEHPGQMHACGHDGHMAMMLGFADLLAERVSACALCRDAVLIFQAAEETVGGAKDICESGILQDCGVGAVYGIHLWPGGEKNEVICRKGDFMASTMVFSLEIEGKSSHVGVYKTGVDALEIGCDFVRRVYEMEEREISPDVHRLLRFGIMNSGAASNIVSGHTYLEGTLRTYSRSVNDFMWERMAEIASDLEARSGAVFRFEHSDPYPAVINPPELFGHARKTLRAAGFEFTEPALPLMTSEDFSVYQKHFPALFLHLATGIGKPLHSGDYTIDEDVLISGVKIYGALFDAYNDSL